MSGLWVCIYIYIHTWKPSPNQKHLVVPMWLARRKWPGLGKLVFLATAVSGHLPWVIKPESNLLLGFKPEGTGSESSTHGDVDLTSPSRSSTMRAFGYVLGAGLACLMLPWSKICGLSPLLKDRHLFSSRLSVPSFVCAARRGRRMWSDVSAGYLFQHSYYGKLLIFPGDLSWDGNLAVPVLVGGTKETCGSRIKPPFGDLVKGLYQNDLYLFLDWTRQSLGPS